MGFEEAESVCQDFGVNFFAVTGYEGVAELVNEAHGEEGAGVDGFGGLGAWGCGLGAEVGKALGELAAGSYVGEEDIAGVAEE